MADRGGWVLVTEENILIYDMPGRSGLDRAILLRELDRACRESRLLHMWIEDDELVEETNGTTTTSETGAQ